ncbi:rad52 recombinase [uncultured Mediterranean phage uvMED]|nr:rad52 recombinase [uncultured Mediterranean phage uvMED]
MTSSEPSSPLQPFPNLGDVITTDDVSQKGSGSYKADYVNWCRTMHLLHEHAPGWQFHLAFYVDDVKQHVFKAPNGTGYVVGYFLHATSGIRTPDFPQAIMDNRNNAIAFDEVSARDLTDSHRRCLCTTAAAQFGLAWQLWAREEVENPHREEKKAKPAAGPSVAGVSKEDQPLSDSERSFLLGWIGDMPTANRDAFCAAFRSQFKLGANAKVAPAITSKKHENWIQAVMNEYA